MLVIREGNIKAAVLCFFIAHFRISFSIISPTSIGSPQTITYKSASLSCDIVVVCVVGMSRDFKILIQILAMGFKLILFITRPSSLAQDPPFTVRVFNTLFHFCVVMLLISLEYSQSTLEGKL